jgi:hypothetical protein
MNQAIVVLFAIPILCIIVIVVSQFKDEMFKKKFVIERRNRSKGTALDRAPGSPGSSNRRFSDSQSPSTEKNRMPESLVARDGGM